jgi:hypothetical protein
VCTREPSPAPLQETKDEAHDGATAVAALENGKKTMTETERFTRVK